MLFYFRFREQVMALKPRLSSPDTDQIPVFHPRSRHTNGVRINLLSFTTPNDLVPNPHSPDNETVGTVVPVSSILQFENLCQPCYSYVGNLIATIF